LSVSFSPELLVNMAGGDTDEVDAPGLVWIMLDLPQPSSGTFMEVRELGRPDVLIVDDEPQVREIVASYLERDGFTVRSAADGRAALVEIGRKRPDVLVLDLMLPEVNGLEVLHKLRSGGDDVPVIVLSARGTEPDKVAGLELGADDYVAKPASPREIAARVRAVLRRVKTAGPTTLSFGTVEVDVTSRRVTKDGDSVELRPKEFDLLVRLASSPGEVMSRQDLLRDVWGSSSEWQDPGTVTVHVRRLRRAIEADPAQPDHIVTVYGIGYRFDP
jgi:DNA-binding response OmpR family regulator